MIYRWIKNDRPNFPTAGFMTPAGKPTWRLATVRACVREPKPVLVER